MSTLQKIALIALGLVVSTHVAQAENLKLHILGEGGDEAGTNLNYPFYLDEGHSWLAQVGFYSNQYDKVEPLRSERYEGKLTTQMDEKNIFASLSYVIPYKSVLFSIGGEYEQFTQEKKQFGYYEDTDQYVPYDHLLDITGGQFNIVADVNYQGDSVNARLTTTITPQTNLDIEQETKVFPSLVNGGTLKSSTNLDLSYLFEGDLKIDMGKYFDIGLEGSYSFTPYKYQLQIVNANRDGYVESTQEYDEIQSKIFGKVFIKKWLSDDIFPTIGFGQTKIEVEDGDSITQSLILVGVEKWF